MNALANHVEVSLDVRAMFSVPDAAGVRFSCRQGSVWITLDGDSRDIVLDPGQDFSSDQHRRALIYALAPAQVRLDTPGAGTQAAARKHAAPRGLVFEQVLA
jgi:hypothetical protein